MDQDQIYFRTKPGEQALAEPMRLLQHNLRRALALVDGRSTLAQIHARFGDEAVAGAALADLLRSGLIAPAEAEPAPAPEVPRPAMLAPSPAVRQQPIPAPVTSSLIEEISLSAGDQFDDDEFAAEEGLPVAPGGQFGSPLQAPPIRLAKPVIRRRWHLSVNWPLLAVIAVLGVAAGMTALLVFFPYANFKPQVEENLAAFLHQPVKIGAMRVTLTPRPNLTLDQIEIGPTGEVRIASAKLIPGAAALLHQKEIVFSAQLDGVELGVKGAELLARGRGAVGKAAWHVDYTTFGNLTLMIGNTRLAHLQGEISAGPGGIESVNMRTEDRNFRVSLTGEGEGFRLSGSALDWKAGGQVVRSLDLAAKLNASGLNFSQFDGGILRGLMSGTLILGWDGRLRSDLSLTRVDASQLWSMLGVDIPVRGELSGNFHVESSADDWSLLLSGARINADVRLARGQVERIDLGAAVRNGNGAAMRGGTTGFDELATGVRRDGTNWRLSNLRLAAGSMAATGDLSITENGPLAGSLQVTLSGKIHSPVAFGGTLKEPVLRGQRGG